MREHTTYWIARFKNSKELGHLRFKKLKPEIMGKLSVEIDESLMDLVDVEDFLKTEEDRIPLFIGTQFGITPCMSFIPGFYDVDRTIAILSKSALSGCVDGLKIYFIPQKSRFNDRRYSNNKLLGDFSNTKLYS